MEGTHWKIMDFDEMLQSILLGDISINQPIAISNTSGDQTKHLSFLSLLMNYPNFNQNNLMDTLYFLLSNFYEMLDNLYENQHIRQLIDRIEGEWYMKVTPITSRPPMDETFLDSYNMHKKKSHETCDCCDKMCHLYDSELEKPISKIDGKKRKELKQSYKELNIVGKTTHQLSNKSKEDLQKLFNYFNKYDMSLLIDLSGKHKSLYLQKTNGHSKNIPDNIHIIFSNYIFLLNLMKKQLIQELKKVSNSIDELTTKLSDIQEKNKTFELMAFINDKSPSELREKMEQMNVPFDKSDSDDSDDSDDDPKKTFY